jgi:hypothetical protein
VETLNRIPQTRRAYFVTKLDISRDGGSVLSIGHTDRHLWRFKPPPKEFWDTRNGDRRDILHFDNKRAEPTPKHGGATCPARSANDTAGP